MTKKLLVTGLALVLAASFAQAATLVLTAKIVGAQDPVTGDPVSYVTSADGATVLSGGAGVYQIEYSFTISDLQSTITVASGTQENPVYTTAPVQGFGNLAFNVVLPAGIIPGYSYDFDATGYVGDATRLATASAPMWATNGDVGASSSDLQGIVVELNTGTAFGSQADTGANNYDYRKIVGQLPFASNAQGRNNSGVFGSLFVAWDGVSGGSVLTDLYQASLVSPYNATDSSISMKFGVDADGTRITNPVVFTAVPEPATMALLGLGALGALLRRRGK